MLQRISLCEAFSLLKHFFMEQRSTHFRTVRHPGKEYYMYAFNILYLDTEQYGMHLPHQNLPQQPLPMILQY
jgi:hypothetical protein